MSLVHNTVYTIRNDLTHTVLDLPVPAGLVRGWGWHGRNTQQWKLITTGEVDKWKLQNQGAHPDPGRFLSLVSNQHDRPLVGATPEGNAVDVTFVIRRVPGPSETYRILEDANRAVTLITGGGPDDGGHNILAADRVPDLHADGPPIAMQIVTNDKTVPKYRAQLWSFLPVAQLPIKNGTYKIVNSQTQLVLDLTGNNANDPVTGAVSSQANQKWIVTKDPNNDWYTFKNSRVEDRFLAPSPGAAPTDNAVLRGRATAEAARFTIRKVPGTKLYKIFYDSLAGNTHRAPGLSVNLDDVAAVAPVAVNLSIRTGAQTQTWAFV